MLFKYSLFFKILKIKINIHYFHYSWIFGALTGAWYKEGNILILGVVVVLK